MYLEALCQILTSPRCIPRLLHLSLKGRPALLPALHTAQSIYGYLPEPVAAEIGRTLGVPLADVYGVIDFFTLFHRQPVGKTLVQVCTDPACALRGGEAVLTGLCRHLNISPGATSPDGAFTVERSPCLGLCEHAPALLLGTTALGDTDIDPLRSDSLLQGIGNVPTGILGGNLRLLTANCGRGRPTTLVEYEASGGYAALRKALAVPPAVVIAEVKASGLVGRGGAAFPTGVKWEGAAKAEGQPRYVVCNADESEPGTFKGRVLMEEDPHRIIEGLIIAAYAVGAHKGYIYIRGEYTNAARVMEKALGAARQSGYLGANILSLRVRFRGRDLYRGRSVHLR